MTKKKKDLILENNSLKSEIEILKVRLGINKKGSITPANSKEENKEKHSLGTEELKSMIENKLNSGFKAIQDNMTKLIDAKMKSVGIATTAAEQLTNSPASYATTVGGNSNAKVTHLRNILAAQRNEELAEQAAQKHREKNIIMHGLSEFSQDVDETFTKELVRELNLNREIITKVERIGKVETGKTRPIKLVLRFVEDKKMVFQNLSNLNIINYKMGINFINGNWDP